MRSELAKTFLKEEASFCGPPDSPGVYGIFIWDRVRNKNTLMYIGSSCRVRKRIMNMNHPYRILSESIGSYDMVVYSTTLETDDYISIEKDLIKELKPKLNQQNNVKRRAKKTAVHSFIHRRLGARH